MPSCTKIWWTVSSLSSISWKKSRQIHITIGDAGVLRSRNRDGYSFKTIYDASTMVTSRSDLTSGDKKAGASEAVLARENSISWTFQNAPEILEIHAEVGFTVLAVIHHSKRPLLQNYFITLRISMMKKTFVNVTSSWLSQVTLKATIPSLKTIMVHLYFLPTMTLIWWPKSGRNW